MQLPINYKESSWYIRKAAREQYVKEQNGNCWFCGLPLNGDPREDIKSVFIDTKRFPKAMFDNPIHLHHSHKTGMTVGAVHARCNAYLWQYKGE